MRFPAMRLSYCTRTGFGWLHVPKGLQDGPMPTHYEPLESPVHNALYSRDTNPVVNWFTRQEKPVRTAR
jgi:formate dehydrogenase major subunit